MEVEERSCNLVAQLLSTLLTHRELAFLQVGKEIATVKLLHNDVDVVLVFKDI